MPLLKGCSPFEVMFGKPHSYSIFHPFGCLVFPYLCDYAPHKLAPQNHSCVFLGYSMSHNGFRCLDCLTNQVFISKYAILDDLGYPYKHSTCSGPFPPTLISTFLEPTANPSQNIVTFEASLPSQPNPLQNLCGPCLINPSYSFVPASIL